MLGGWEKIVCLMKDDMGNAINFFEFILLEKHHCLLQKKIVCLKMRWEN